MPFYLYINAIIKDFPNIEAVEDWRTMLLKVSVIVVLIKQISLTKTMYQKEKYKNCETWPAIKTFQSWNTRTAVKFPSDLSY